MFSSHSAHHKNNNTVVVSELTILIVLIILKHTYVSNHMVHLNVHNVINCTLVKLNNNVKANRDTVALLDKIIELPRRR